MTIPVIRLKVKVKNNSIISAGPILDWAVAKCKYKIVSLSHYWKFVDGYGDDDFEIPYYSTSWRDGGPIIDEEGIEFRKATNGWWASYPGKKLYWGETHLAAAMSCFVAGRITEEDYLAEKLRAKQPF